MVEYGNNLEKWLLSAPRRPLLMGILNVTPDSFSDGGTFWDRDAAVRRARRMIEEGAAIIDVGGESTRPGSEGVDPSEQVRRVVPVINALRDDNVVISVDTTSSVVARAAIDAGATVINDITAGRADPEMLSLAARTRSAVILMHMQGTPRTMQANPLYTDVVDEVLKFLSARAKAAMDAGVERHRILIDVGIGFGKSLEHNLTLLREHRRFAALDHATVLGTSRKGFIGTLTRQPVASDRLMGTAATIAWGLANGADILRVHDVAAMREVVEMITAIRGDE